MAIIKHLTKEDYLTSTCKSKTFEDLGERLNELEEDLLLPLSVSLENEDGTFLVGTDKEGQKVDFEEGFAGLEVQGKSEQGTTEEILKNIESLTMVAPIGFDYHYNTFWSNLEVDVPYTFTIENTELLEGTASDFTITAYDYTESKGVETKICQIGTKTTFSFTLPLEKKEHNISLLLYTGRAGATSGNGVEYTGLKLVAHRTVSPNFPSEINSVGEEVEVEIDGVLEKRYKIGILSEGKNLFNVEKFVADSQNASYYTLSNGVLSTTKLDSRSIDFKYGIKLAKGTYTVNVSNSCTIRVYVSKSGTFNSLDCIGLNATTNPMTFTLKDDCYVAIKFFNTSSSITYPLEIGYVQLEKKNTATKIQEYKLNKTTLLLKEPLRGVEGGKFDKIVEEDGKLKVIRYYKEEVFNGSEYWTVGYGGATGTENKFELLLSGEGFNNTSSSNIPSICSHFVWFNTHAVPPINKYRAQYSSNGNLYLLFNIDTNIVPLHDTATWKNWLKTNNVSVVYEMVTPTEEILHQSINPYVYENGHLTVESGEVQAPTVHTVNTNLKGTVEANAKEIELLKTNLDSLEGFYDNYLLESDYAIAKTGLDIYFDYMVEE